MGIDIWTTIHAERHALADDLSGLTEEQWATGSLCSEWTVHDVLAHLLASAKMTPARFIGKMARAGFGFNRFTAREVELEGGGGPEHTLAAFKQVLDRTSTPPGPKETWLGEAIVHSEDIRRPLGLTHNYPMADVVRVLQFYSRSDAIIGGKSRVAGLTLRATDADCTIGSGPEVRGPALSLVLMASGRKSALVDLDGVGLTVLSERG
jgi:uncharacterized protein (TIGR03083 family)